MNKCRGAFQYANGVAISIKIRNTNKLFKNELLF